MPGSREKGRKGETRGTKKERCTKEVKQKGRRGERKEGGANEAQEELGEKRHIG